MKKLSQASVVPVLAVAVIMAVMAWVVLSPGSEQPETAIPPGMMVEAKGPNNSMVTLPEDAEAMHVSMFVHDDWSQRPRERAMVALAGNLADVQRVVHWHIYGENNPTYRSQLADKVPVTEFPVVMVQTKDGTVVAKVSGSNVPDDPKKLGRLIRRLREKRPYYLLPWRRPDPKPSPNPAPGPDLTPVPPVVSVRGDLRLGSAIPDTAPDPPWGLAALAAGLSGVGGVAYRFRQKV